MAGIPTTPLPAVRVLWRPEQFNRVTNGDFETNTSGWSASAGINAAATSITRITTDAHGGSACASVVCTSTDGSGVNWDFGTDGFRSEAGYGAIHMATGWIKRVSGSTSAKVILGSEGTSTDRATLELTLADAWQPFAVRWLPTTSRTDVQLAITNGSAEAVTFLIDDVAVHLADCFSQVENGSFEVSTNGWTAITSGSFARSTAEAFGGSACMRITSGASSLAGAYWDFFTRTFTSGRTFRARAAVKSISGSGDWYLDIGDTGAGDTASVLFTPTGTFTWVTVDWTPSATRTAVTLRFRHNAASSAVLAVDEVEAYEAIDDLGTDAGTMRWSRVPGQINPIAVEVANGTGKYDPRNASGALYGLLMPGRRILGRATYGGALYPLFHGTLRTIESRTWDAKADLLADDTWADLVRADFGSSLDPDRTYHEARAAAVAAALTRDPDIGDTVGSGHVDVATAGIEANTFFDATDGDDSAAGYLGELDDATQSVSWCRPSVHANTGWEYVTVDRATLTDTSSDFTVDEDFEAFDGVRVTDEALENRQAIPWQSYAPMTMSPTWYDGDTQLYILAYALDTTTWGDAYGEGAESPYLHFTDDALGSDDDHPEPRWRYPRGWSSKRWLRRRRKGHKVPRRTRIFPDAFVPFDLGTSPRDIVISFATPVTDVQTSILDAGFQHEIVERRPTQVTVRLTPYVDNPTVTALFILGTPYLASDDAEAVVEDLDSQAVLGVYPGDSLSTPYIPSLGDAQGVGAYRDWRYSRPRMRPTLVDHNTFPRTLTASVTDHFTVSADRWNVDALLFVSTGCRWEVTAGGLDWRSWHDLEELPDHTDWFVLDTSTLDGSDVLAY